MLILPAIDIYEGQAVRLYKGDYAQKTIYSADPLKVAQDFAEQGAKWIHLVDLEGAKNGTTANFELISRIKEESGLNCEVGGGIRDMATIEKYLEKGMDRLILGTAALTDRGLLKEALNRYGEKIAVGMDLKEGRPAINGWTKTGDMKMEEFCQDLCELGVRTLICTDVSKDGAMKGSNHALYKELSEKYPLQIIASGGVSSLEDVRQLRALDIYGAIIGKAYYTGAISLKEAIQEAL